MEVLKPWPNSQIAAEIGVDDGTLRKWVNNYRKDPPGPAAWSDGRRRGGLSAQERAAAGVGAGEPGAAPEDRVPEGLDFRGSR